MRIIAFKNNYIGFTEEVKQIFKLKGNLSRFNDSQLTVYVPLDTPITTVHHQPSTIYYPLFPLFALDTPALLSYKALRPVTGINARFPVILSGVAHSG